MKVKTKNKKKLQKLVTLLLIPSLLIMGYFTFAYTTRMFWPFYEASMDITQPPNTINYDPPTDSEIKNSQNAKRTLTEGSEENSQSVDINISYASYNKAQQAFEVDAFVAGVIEGGGTCTAQLTLDEMTVTGSSKGFVDATTTQCRPILIPANEVSSGQWSLTVSYRSGGYTGTSDSMYVEVSR
jgi:hypothetical protein